MKSEFSSEEEKDSFEWVGAFLYIYVYIMQAANIINTNLVSGKAAFQSVQYHKLFFLLTSFIILTSLLFIDRNIFMGR